MLSVSDENLNLKNEDLKSYLEYYNRLGKPLVEDYTSELDEKVNSVKTYLNQIKEYDLQFDVLSLQKIVIDLSSTIYFTQERVEKLGLLEDLSKIQYKKTYNDAYMAKQGAATLEARKYTADQLRAIADIEALEDNIINFIYSHATSVLKSKIDAAFELLKAVSKCLSAEIQSMQTFGMNRQ